MPGAAVTFSVIGGGGTLVDPASGRPTDKRGHGPAPAPGARKRGPLRHAQARRGGGDTAPREADRRVPRFTCEEPFTCTCPEGEECDPDDPVGYTTQVGMNLVTARSGGRSLADPFTAFGFPEKLPVEEGRASRSSWAWRSAPQYNPVNLTVADRLALRVTDRHGNPLSNVRTQVAFRRPARARSGRPRVEPLPRGHDHAGARARERRLRRAASRPTPPSSGASAPDEARGGRHPLVERGRLRLPDPGRQPLELLLLRLRDDPRARTSSWIGYHTNGLTCPHPDPSPCPGHDQPLTFVWQGTGRRPGQRPGQRRGGLRARGPAAVDLWADVVYEEAEVTRTVDGQGQEHFSVTGDERLAPGAAPRLRVPAQRRSPRAPPWGRPPLTGGRRDATRAR